MKIFKLISGDPLGEGKLTDYAFEKITLEGKDEFRIAEQLKQWSLCDHSVTELLTENGDHWGGALSDTIRTRLSRLADSCFIHGGELLGYKTDKMILFLNGNVVGRASYSDYNDRSETHGTYSLEKTADTTK